MTYPTIFANLPAGNQPASLLDTMFNIAGSMGAIPCTAAGTNAITLTPNTNAYLPAAYSNYQIVSFVAVATATGAVTVKLGALAFVKLFMPSGLQANAGDININSYYIAAFNAALDSGNGGFIVFNASTPSVIQPVRSTFKNLTIQNGGTPDTQVSVTADEVMLENVGGGTAKVSNVNVTISTVASGVNGLDSGTVAADSFYSVWVIYNGSTIAGLISASPTSPALPAGYTYSARLGYVATGLASTNLRRTLQKGRSVQYVVVPGSQTPALPFIANGVGAFWTQYTVVNNVVPGTASKIQVVLATAFTASNNTNRVGVAPNNNYGTIPSTNPYPPVGFGIVTGVALGTFEINQTLEIVLESNSIFAGASGPPAFLTCLGWEDNI